jgi:hypothetical protein
MSSTHGQQLVQRLSDSSYYCADNNDHFELKLPTAHKTPMLWKAPSASE